MMAILKEDIVDYLKSRRDAGSYESKSPKVSTVKRTKMTGIFVNIALHNPDRCECVYTNTQETKK